MKLSERRKERVCMIVVCRMVKMGLLWTVSSSDLEVSTVGELTLGFVSSYTWDSLQDPPGALHWIGAARPVVVELAL